MVSRLHLSKDLD